MARISLDQHQAKNKAWVKAMPGTLQFRMEKVARIMLTTAQREHLHAADPMPRGVTGGFEHSTLSQQSSDLIKHLALKSAVQSKKGKGKVTVKLGTNLTNRGYSYPRAHEYGLGKMPERPWLRPSIKKNKELLREEIKKGMVAAYGK